jgi:hypothetical protein
VLVEYNPVFTEFAQVSTRSALQVETKLSNQGVKRTEKVVPDNGVMGGARHRERDQVTSFPLASLKYGL